MESLPISTDHLSFLLSQCFGTGCRLIGIDKLTGGTRKKVYRIETNPSYPPLVLLVWHNEHDYFREQGEASIQSDKQAPWLYRANTELLRQHGVRIPETYVFDNSLEQIPHAFALVEFVRGVTYHQYQQTHSRKDTIEVLRKINAYLHKLHEITREQSGTVVEKQSQGLLCHQQAFEIACSDLAGLEEAFESVHQARAVIRSRLETLSQEIRQRKAYTFIHGELGPDEHLLIDEQGEIVIIDIDGCHFHDVEREHSYLKLRFGEDYAWMRREGLDPIRMAFYGLCLHLSAAYGHYRLHVQGYPEPEMLRGIYEWNISQILGILNKVKEKDDEQ